MLKIYKYYGQINLFLKFKMLTDFNNAPMKRDCQCKREDEVYKHFPSNILE